MKPVTDITELPPDLHRLTFTVQSTTPTGEVDEQIVQMQLYGSKEDLATLQAVIESLTEALNERDKE